MKKKNTSQKQSFSWSDVPKVRIKNRKGLTRVNTAEYLKDKDKVIRALFQCLDENDTEAFMEILTAFISVNLR